MPLADFELKDEVKTEGYAFMISFQHASQGLGFSIDVQSRLFEAKWPEFLLNDNDVKNFAGNSDDGAWRGLRVRIGLHTGACISEVDPTTYRMVSLRLLMVISSAVEVLGSNTCFASV